MPAAAPSPERAPCTFVAGFTTPVDLTPCPFHHHHATAEIVHHPSGRGHTRMGDGAAVAFAPGDTVLYPPYLSHDQQLSEPGVDCCVQMHLPESLATRLRDGVVVRGPLPGWLAHELAELGQAQSGSGAFTRRILDHRATAVLLALLDGAESFARLPGSEPGQRLADQAATVIAERFQHLGRLEEVAVALGVGYDQLRRTFRKHRGTSLVEWLTEVRITRAKELLAHTPLAQEEIARQCGYGSARYLNMVFKQVTGTTPGDWRKQA